MMKLFIWYLKRMPVAKRTPIIDKLLRDIGYAGSQIHHAIADTRRLERACSEVGVSRSLARKIARIYFPKG